MMINISLSGDQIAQINLLRQLINHIKNGSIGEIQNMDPSKVATIISRVDPTVQQTPLLAACLYNDEEISFNIIKLLISRGANPQNKDAYNQTIIFYLARDGKLKILEYLLTNYKFNLNDQDNYCQTPIFFAARQNRLNTVQLLLSHGANINHKDKNDQTCFFYAASQGHYQMCKLLIKMGVELFHVDLQKRTALNFAKKNNRQSVIDLINSHKQKQKKMKQINKVKEKDSSMNQKKKVKKESQKSDCVLIFTDQSGNVHQLNQEELEQFKKHNERVFQLMCNPEQLDLEPTPPERKFQKTANKILNNLWKMPGAFVFHTPVNWQLLDAKDYLTIIKRPMDFGTIKTKLQNNAYQNHSHFAEDMILVFDNCILYNGSEHQYGKIALNLKKQFGSVYNEFFI